LSGRPRTIVEHEARIATKLAGLHPELRVRRMLRVARILIGDRAVAETGPKGFRLVEDEEWRPLNIDRAADLPAIRVLMTRAVGALGRPPEETALRTGPEPVRRAALDPGASAAPKPAPPHTPDAWAEALTRRGAPATVVDGSVLVERIGAVAVPSPEQKLSKAATRFERDQTKEVIPDLTAVLNRTLGSLVANVVLRTRKGRIRVLVGDEEIAAVTRFRAIGKVTITADFIATPEALEPIGPAVEHELERRRREEERRRAAAIKRGVPPTITRSPLRPPSSEPPITSTPPSPVVPSPGPASNVLISFPSSLAHEPRVAGMLASARLRAERTLVPAVPVEVQTPHGTLRFEPLDERTTPLEAQFTFRRRGHFVAGGLRLKRREDPISLRVTPRSRYSLVGEAWAAALVVYAELTCVDPDAPIADAPRSPTRPSPGSSRRPRGGSGRPGPSSRRRGWGDVSAVELESFRSAVEQLSAVSGHLRRLPAGHRASEEQLRAAERAGIRVPQGFTWVRPHGRGSHAAVRVRWPRGAPLW
jgi:hypothetical protein